MVADVELVDAVVVARVALALAFGEADVEGPVVC